MSHARLILTCGLPGAGKTTHARLLAADARNSQPPWDGHPIRRADLDQWARRFEAPDAGELARFDAPPQP